MADETDTSAAGSETTDTGTPLQAQAPSLLDEAGAETGGDDQTGKTEAQAEGEGGEIRAKEEAKDGTKTEGEKDDKGEAEGAPEEYADFTVPEGSTLEDWPVSYDDLEPYYEKAEWEVGVSGDESTNPFKGPRRKPLPAQRTRPSGRPSRIKFRSRQA